MEGGGVGDEGDEGGCVEGEERTFCRCSLSVVIAHSPTFIPFPNPCSLTRIAEPREGAECS